MWQSKHSVLKSPNLSRALAYDGSTRDDIVSHGLLPSQTESLVKRERRKQYPKNWEQLARQCKERAGWQCQFCHVKQGRKRTSKRTGKRYPVYLHAAHRDHDLDNPYPVLLCLCPTCHGRYDYQYRVRQQQIAVERLKHQRMLVAR